MNPIITLPEIVIEREGIALSAQETIALGEVRVQQMLLWPTQCQLIFRDPPGPLGIDTALQPGTMIRVLVRGQRTPLFSGQVTEVEHYYEPSGGREFIVRAYDLLHRLRKNGAVRTHVQVTLDDVAREFAAPHGLAVQSHESAPPIQYAIQHRQNDLQFLQEWADRSGLYFCLREDVLHIFSLAGIPGDALPLRLGENLLEARIEVSAESAVSEIAASGWDTAHIGVHSERAANPRSGRSVGGSVSPGDVGAASVWPLLDLGVESAAQAETLAQAELDFRAGYEIVLDATAQGDTRLRPGASVEIAGVAPSAAGTYVLTLATHRINQHDGYITDIASAPPVSHKTKIARGTVATPGVVTQIDDPDGLGRVRVALPSFENVVTDWINVVSVGAGAGKGLMIQPDVNDGVLVLLAHEDPAQAVVIGGLYGAQGTPDVGIEDGAVRRYTLLTPGGQRVRLDDSGQVIRLENSDGSSIELSPEKVRIHAARDLEIEAPGKAIVIRGNTIDFQQG